MTITGKIGEVSRNEERARGAGHDPVILAGKVKVNQGTLPVGLVLSRDDSKEFIPYEEARGVDGILDEDVDTTSNGSALYVAHGSVKLDVLKADTSGTAPDADLLVAIQAASIYPG